MSELVTLEVSGRVAHLALNRPEKRNALSLDLLEALHGQVRALAARADQPDPPTVCVLRGAGPAFCAGMDLKAVLKEPGAPFRLLSAIAELTIALRRLPLVTVARVSGAAIGGGCGLVAVCDIAVTHPDAKLGYPEVDLGVCPAVVAPWLVQAIGAGQARRVLLQGGTMTGLRAHEIGLVSHCVPAEQLDAAIDEITGRLSKAGALALRATKQLLNDLESERVVPAVRQGARISADVIAGEEAQRLLGKVYGQA